MPTLKLNNSNGMLTIELAFVVNNAKRFYEFIVDSGSETTILIPSLLEKKEIIGKEIGIGFGGESETFVYRSRFRLIGIHLPHTTLADRHLLEIGRITCGDRFGGLIGLDILCQFRSVEFFLQSRKLSSLRSLNSFVFNTLQMCHK